mmetsp:Transcript_89273/g.157972  ORF Transcript_89273/g.157972 Transcript_89273/m.157972 type:complete len:309 (+) Transcript_89273:3-929(+)
MAPQIGVRLSTTPRSFGRQTADTQWGIKCRAFHSAAALGFDHVVVFGGWERIDGSKKLLNDLWFVNTAEETIESLCTDGPQPSARCRHDSAMQGTNFLVLGGESAAPFEVWTIDLSDALRRLDAQLTLQGCSDAWFKVDCEPQTSSSLQRKAWLHPNISLAAGQILVFGGYSSAAGFDHFFDPTGVEMGQATGDVVGSFLSIPWHPLFESHHGRVLSSASSSTASSSTTCTGEQVAPIAFVGDNRSPFVLTKDLKTDLLAVYQWRLSEPEMCPQAPAALKAEDHRSIGVNLSRFIRATALRICRWGQR